MKKITSFNVSWTADHEQYWQGHGIAFTNYTHCAIGCGETLREAFGDALEDLAQQDITDADNFDMFEKEMLAELASQVKEPELLDLDIVQGYCPDKGDHKRECPHSNPAPNDPMDHSDCEYCDDSEEVTDEDPDCAVCAGDWHFYVSIDVTVEESTNA